LDDLTGGLDEKWIVAKSHPNVDIRLFNPFAVRENNWIARGPEWLFNISKLNHRMHNKLLLVDRKSALVGGRNISNAYFGLGDTLDYRNFELLALGPIADRLDSSFETYWNSYWTQSPRELSGYRASATDLRDFRKEINARLSASTKLQAALNESEQNWGRLLTDAHERAYEGTARVVYDCPPYSDSEMPIQRVTAVFGELIDRANSDVFVVSPYIVLSGAVRDRLRQASERGVRVRLFTNSLQAADNNIAFGGYRKRRRKLLNEGIELYEQKPHGTQWRNYRTPESSGQYLSLHAKLSIIDEDKVMVGSLNLDPRSKYLNTEIGLFVRSRALADAIQERFSLDLHPENTWRVQTNARGKLYWKDSEGKVDDEPSRSFGQRMQVFLFSLLPLDSQI
jgi:putative cardiolipin synthase